MCVFLMSVPLFHEIICFVLRNSDANIIPTMVPNIIPKTVLNILPKIIQSEHVHKNMGTRTKGLPGRLIFKKYRPLNVRKLG